MTTDVFRTSSPHAGAHEEWAVDERGNITIRRTQDASGIVEALNILRAEGAGRRALGGAGRYVGSVPIVLAEQWSKECGFPVGTKGFLEYCKRKLSDGDNAKLLVNRF